MKKNKLIEMLTAIPGNPDIKLWNGLVGDWMDINPELGENHLVKVKFDLWLSAVCHQTGKIVSELSEPEIKLLKKKYRTLQWNVQEYTSPDDRKIYKFKRIVFLDAKMRGKTTHDRLGKISY